MEFGHTLSCICNVNNDDNQRKDVAFILCPHFLQVVYMQLLLGNNDDLGSPIKSVSDISYLCITMVDWRQRDCQVAILAIKKKTQMKQ